MINKILDLTIISVGTITGIAFMVIVIRSLFTGVVSGRTKSYRQESFGKYLVTILVYLFAGAVWIIFSINYAIKFFNKF